MTYKTTAVCCYIGYVTQAVVINFAPLLFVVFHKSYNISYALIGTLVFINFLTQMLVDVLSVFMVDKIGLRRAAVSAHFCCAAGFALFPVLPAVLPDAYTGICIATILYSIGAGLIEVVINPISASLPQKNEGSLIFTHSFYSWGQLTVVLLSTLFLRVFGENSWIFIAPLWGIIPLVNGIMFTKVPMTLPAVEEKREKAGAVISNKVFICILVLMIAAGGAELAMSQWASTFAQNALGVDKTLGDILGPCLFALFMGIGRTVHGAWGEKLNYELHMYLNSVLCILCYVTAVFSKNPYIALAGCSICGYAVSIMWPGVVSLVAQKFPNGSRSLYGLIAIFGDVGCSIAPFITGLVASAVSLKAGLLVNVIFPLMFIIVFKMVKKFSECA